MTYRPAAPRHDTAARHARRLDRRAFLRGITGAAGLAASGCSTHEGPFPSREIRMIVHASPGGISDAVSRYIARDLQTLLQVPVLCENRAGGVGLVAFSYVRAAKPDGYTIGYAPVDLAIVPHLGYTSFSPQDVDPLVMHTRAAAALAVGTAAAWRTLEVFIEAARAVPRGIDVGASGPGAIWHLASLAFARRIGATLNDVPFPGSGPAVTALLGGHLHAVVAGVSELRAHVESGSVRLLGVMAPKRSPLVPEVPTFAERGLDLRFQAWGGFMLPKGTPRDRRARLAAALLSVIRGAAFKDFCRSAGLEVAPLGPAEFRRFVIAEHDAFGPIVRAAGLGVAPPGAKGREG
jgi:tripartite-type tricarboxylate transporter receptor subunit TctC